MHGSPTSSSSPTRPRRTVWRIWGGVALTVAVVVALVWLLWGFRWPPTAAVVLDGEPESATVVR